MTVEKSGIVVTLRAGLGVPLPTVVGFAYVLGYCVVAFVVLDALPSTVIRP